VKGADILRALDGLESNRINQLPVLQTMQTTRAPAVFAISRGREGFDTPVPPRAQAAHRQASHMIGQIDRLLAGKPMEPIVYRDFGSLVSRGRSSTVGSLMGFIVGKSMFIEGSLPG